MVLKLPKIVHFLQICADLSKKPNHALSENSIFFIGVRDINSSQDIKE